MTLMRQEAQECAAVSRRFLTVVLPQLQQEAQQWLRDGYECMEVLGRGSSSHAGTVLRYAMSEHSSMLISAAMPLAAQHQHGPSSRSKTVLVALSQSGKSPDLIQYASLRKAQGARVLALVNTEGSELASVAHRSIVLGAGTERAVAATKSTLAACLAGLGLVAFMGRAKGTPLLEALTDLPQRLDQAINECSWDAMSAALPGSRAVYFVGRGATFGIAKELALKVSETTGIPAMAYSSAEFLHGPIGAVNEQTLVIALSTSPELHESIQLALNSARNRNAICLSASTCNEGDLPLPYSSESYTGALTILPPAYLSIEAATVQMGRSPDSPAGLNKVTCTH